MNAASTASHGLFLGQSCYLTTISRNCLIVCLVSDDIRENSSLNLNKFICDELQPNEEFHRLFNDAFNSLYRKLQTDLQDTKYACATESTIHNLIKVGGQTAPRKLQTDLQDTEYACATESKIHNLIKVGGQTAPRKLQTDLQDTEYATESTIHNLIKVGGQTAPFPSPEKWVVEKDAGKKCRCRCR